LKYLPLPNCIKHNGDDVSKDYNALSYKGKQSTSIKAWWRFNQPKHFACFISSYMLCVWEVQKIYFIYTFVFHRSSRFWSKIVYLSRLHAGINWGIGLQFNCVLHTALKALDVGSGNNDTLKTRFMR